MKRFLTAALFLFQFALVSAQDSTNVGNLTFEPEQPPGEIIKLDVNIPVHQFAMPVKNIQVLAICGDNAVLGALQYRTEKVRALAIPDKPLQEYLQEYVNRQYSDQYRKDGKELLCVIQYLRIGDRGRLDKSYVRIKAAGFHSSDNQQFQLSCQIDTTLSNDTKRASRKHSENIAQVIDLLMQAADKSRLTVAFHSKEEIVNKAWERYKQPIYSADTLTDGIYTSYREFLKNAPSVRKFRVSMEYNKIVAYHLHDDSTSNVIKEPWGMCHQGRLYRFKWNGFIPLKRNGLSFDLVDFGLETNKDIKGTAGRVVDIVGGLLFLGPAGIPLAIPSAYVRGGYTVNAIPYLVDPPIATTIDPFTGELMF